MKRNKLLALGIVLCFLFSCCAGARENIEAVSEGISMYSEESEAAEATTINYDYIRGIWVSQFDMHYVYCDKGVQRDEESYTALIKTMLANIKRDNFNTVYLQLRPNGDSMYDSALFPVSRYISGAYGGDIEYDAVKIFIEHAHALGISVQGWINPLRLMTVKEMEVIDDRFQIKKWYLQNNGRVVNVDGRLYLNPAYDEVRQLIVDGAAEIMERFEIDGIHMDDYFYPTTEAYFDIDAFWESGYDDLGEFRRGNINLLVKGLYEAVKEADRTALYGISPAGNLNSLRNYYYADVFLWCSESGYIDYILPQLYYGFLNRSCPFDKTLSDWAAIVTEPDIKLIIGLCAYKTVMAASGEIDAFAGTEEGKNEWINSKDILSRSLLEVYNEEKASGYCFFCYQYLYDVLTGEHNPAFAEERQNIGELLYFIN